MRPLRFVVFALVLGACQSAPTPGALCAITADCASPLVCRLGRCRSECAANRDCPIGSVCLLDAMHVGSCSVDVDTRCESGGHACPTGLVCVGDRCANTCTTDADCPSDGLCRMAGTTGLLFCFAPGRDDADAGSPIDASTPRDAGPPRSGTVAPILMPADGNAAGQYVAMSADGTRAVVTRFVLGTPIVSMLDVLRRNGTTWELEQTLTATSAFGSPTLSDDGTILVVADGTTVTPTNVVRHFTRTGSSWAEDAPIVGPGDWPVSSISIDATGARVALGAALDVPSTVQTGSARVYALAGGAWSVEADLAPMDLDRLSGFGGTVSLSGDGATLLVGAGGQHQYDMLRDVGEVHVFTRTSSTWTEQPLLLPSTHARSLGASVALSRDGQHALVGAGQDGVSAILFDRNGTGWTQSTAFTGPTGFGVAFALSADGSRVLVSSPREPAGAGLGVGMVYEYAAGSSASIARWSPASGAVTAASFGASVALDAAGIHAIAGDPLATTMSGAIAGGAWFLDLP